MNINLLDKKLVNTNFLDRKLMNTNILKSKLINTNSWTLKYQFLDRKLINTNIQDRKLRKTKTISWIENLLKPISKWWKLLNTNILVLKFINTKNPGGGNFILPISLVKYWYLPIPEGANVWILISWVGNLWLLFLKPHQLAKI